MSRANSRKAASVPSSSTSGQHPYIDPDFLGALDELVFDCAAREVCVEGPAGTGKSFAALWKMHLRRLEFPRSRGLLARKTLISLKSSTLVTYREQVARWWIDRGKITFHAAKADEPAHYFYHKTKSRLVIAGLDKPGKAMSTEYDDVLVDEALDCEEEDIETLLTRIQRPGHLYGVDGRPPYAQLILVTNPGAPTHWLNQRMAAGRALRLRTILDDNPMMTREYRELLNKLTGVRRLRLLEGKWAAAEGTVYEDSWLPERNLRPRKQYSIHPDSLSGDCGIDPALPRYMAIDWGYRAPLSVQWYVKLRDGQLVLYREIYTTMRLVEDVAKEALGYMGWKMTTTGALQPTRKDPDPLPREIVADHDAEDRATWEKHFGLGVCPARKGKDSISDGIQAMAKRLYEGRLVILQDSLVQRDPLLDAAKKPCGFAEEIDAYVWDTRAMRAPREIPVDDYDHAMDAARYLVTYFDRTDHGVGFIEFHAPGYSYRTG